VWPALSYRRSLYASVIRGYTGERGDRGQSSPLPFTAGAGFGRLARSAWIQRVIRPAVLICTPFGVAIADGTWRDGRAGAPSAPGAGRSLFLYGLPADTTSPRVATTASARICDRRLTELGLLRGAENQRPPNGRAFEHRIAESEGDQTLWLLRRRGTRSIARPRSLQYGREDSPPIWGSCDCLDTGKKVHVASTEFACRLKPTHPVEIERPAQ